MLADAFDVFLIDLDGVVYVGDRVLPHAVETLDRLRAAGKRLRFLTNNPRPLRASVVRRLSGHGIAAREDQIITSGRATALYLAQAGLRSALVVGSDELRQEIAAAGVEVMDDGPVDAAVVGCAPEVGYADIRRAARAIAAGAAFIATNNDAAYPTHGGPAPATGAIVAAVATASGVRPRIVGKPFAPMFDMALADVTDRDRVVMIGDTLAADIAGAHRAGVRALLVAGAVPDIPHTDPRRPDAVIPHLGALLSPDYRLNERASVVDAVPERIAPCVGAVVCDPDGRVLLVRRRDNGLWALPTGHVEPGERLAEAVVRELREETGLAVRIDRMSGLYSNPDTQVVAFPDGRVAHFVTACFLCSPVSGTLRPQPEEVAEVRFCAVAALPAPMVAGHLDWIETALAGGAPVVD